MLGLLKRAIFTPGERVNPVESPGRLYPFSSFSIEYFPQ
jgi:hypothetical protein